MKYKFILQEMKEASDPNVKAFLKDVERMKRLTKQEKDFYLKTRYLSSSVKKLVEDLPLFAEDWLPEMEAFDDGDAEMSIRAMIHWNI